MPSCRNPFKQLMILSSVSFEEPRGKPLPDDKSHKHHHDLMSNHNSNDGEDAVRRSGENGLSLIKRLSLFHRLKKLAKMVRTIPDFPREGINFQHVLGISEHPGGLSLCTRLIQSCLVGGWDGVDAVVCCEAGGFIFGPPVAQHVEVPLVLIRAMGKLPPPTLRIDKSESFISSSTSTPGNRTKEDVIEMRKTPLPGTKPLVESKHLFKAKAKVRPEGRPLPEGASLVVIDDVLATGNTLYAMLVLLHKAGVALENIRIFVVAEFPAHGAREGLIRKGLGEVRIQSLLTLDGM